jgi:hypothetical protein
MHVVLVAYGVRFICRGKKSFVHLGGGYKMLCEGAV